MTGDLRVLNCLSDPRLGGPQRRALLNADRLRAETGIQTEFLLPAGPDTFETQVRDQGFVVHRPRLRRLHPPRYLRKNIAYFGSVPFAVYRILSLIKTRDVDVVHVNSPVNLYPAVAGWLSDASVVWHFNGYNFPTVVLQGIRRVAPVMADEFVFSSSVVREQIFDSNVQGMIIFPPVDMVEFDRTKVDPRASIREEFDIDDDVPIVGTVGNITPAKDHNRLLRAVRRVIDQWGEIAVPIVGGISETKRGYARRVRALCDELELADHVLFLGWRSDVRELLAAFDLFVLSSKMETGPMSLVEAMAMEVPVVTTRVGAVRDVDGINAVTWVASPESVVELEQALRSALESKDQWRSLGTNARRFAKRQFSLERSVSQHEELYRSLSRESGNGSGGIRG